MDFGLNLRRFGVNVLRAPGEQPVFWGIHAVRGVLIMPCRFRALDLILDGKLIETATLTALPMRSRRGWFKHVFNVWVDASGWPVGDHTMTLAFRGCWFRWRRRRRLTVAVPPSDCCLPTSDTSIPIAEIKGNETVVAAVNALPSMVRPARRAVISRDITSILVIRADQLGDLVVSVPAIRRLRAVFPDAQLVGLVTSANAGLARSLRLFDTLEVAQFPEEPVSGRRVMEAAEQQRLNAVFSAQRFDLAIDLSEGEASRPLLRLSGARLLCGFDGRAFPWLTLAYNSKARDILNGGERASHGVKTLGLVEWLAVLAGAPARAEPLEQIDQAALSSYGVPRAARYAVLHTGARLEVSRWPHYNELSRLLLSQTDLHLVFIADDSAQRASLPPDLLASARFHFHDRPQPFAAFEALLAGCAVFVGNDSGPKHLAALRGARVVSLHMARLNWDEWGQESGGWIVSRRVPCAGCGIHAVVEECGQGYACLTRISPQEVASLVVRLIDEIP